MPTVIELGDETTWPSDVRTFLDERHSTFLNWERQVAGISSQRVSPSAYDHFIGDLRVVLSNYAIHGYHCTRLTVREIGDIVANGLQMPNRNVLRQRIGVLEKIGTIESHIANRLREENLADDQNRAGMIWFCFFPPHKAGQRGIERLFRSWGGEALYVCHERDPETGPILNTIGVPCIVEADIPVANLPVHGGLDAKIAMRYLFNRGYEVSGHIDHEDRAKHPIAPENIRRIIEFPSEQFVSLSRCDSWSPPLT